MLWDKQARVFRMAYDTQYPYVCAGSGYGMLSLAWPACGFSVTLSGKREYLAGSVLQLLKERKVRAWEEGRALFEAYT